MKILDKKLAVRVFYYESIGLGLLMLVIASTTMLGVAANSPHALNDRMNEVEMWLKAFPGVFIFFYVIIYISSLWYKHTTKE